jgi:uncharacterized membrane protein YgcG
MSVNIQLDYEGRAIVEETIFVDFNKKQRGIIRKIPYKYRLDGNSYITKITKIDSGTDQQKVNRSNGNTTIRIGDPKKYIQGKKTYQISYIVEGPYIRSESFDEFYWNITGNEWETSIGKASFNIVLPEGENIRYNDVRYFTGKSNRNDKEATVFTDQNVIYGATNKRLKQGEGLTVAIKLPLGFVKNKKIFSQKPLREQTKISEESSWWMTIPGLLIVAILGWWKGLRGSKVEYDPIPISYPPKGLSPAEVGTFIDNIAHDRDIIALIPFWAEMGLIKITRMENDDLMFERLENIQESRPPYEIAFFNKIFEEGDLVMLSKINTNMYQTMSATKRAVKKSLIKDRLYDKRYMKWFRSWWSISIGFLILAVAILCLSLGLIKVGVLTFLASSTYFILRAFNPPASEEGLALRSKIKGLEAHLKDNDPDVISNMISADSKYYERLFPYAFALGLEKSWSIRAEKHGSSYPSWYYVDPSINSRPSISSMNDVFAPKTITSAFSKVPASSKSSGGFSSGSSGGGFGGGGGSSW